MTVKARYENKTEFSKWLRKEPSIDSKKGYNTSDIDYIWSDGTLYMVLEEKRYMGKMENKQIELYKIIHNNCKSDIVIYKGCHLIQFEYVDPDRGKIYLDYKEINKDTLLNFLRFRCADDIYNTIIFNNTQLNSEVSTESVGNHMTEKNELMDIEEKHETENQSFIAQSKQQKARKNESPDTHGA